MKFSRMRAITIAIGFALGAELWPLLSDGQPLNWDPPAIRAAPGHAEIAEQPNRLTEFIEIGQVLFTTKFNLADGAGRPGSTGDSKPTPRSPESSGLLTRISGPDALSCHACHIQPQVGGSGDMVANVFVGAHFSDVPVQATAPEVTNERNTLSVAGAGLIEIAASEITADLQALRARAMQQANETDNTVRVKLSSKGVDFGFLSVRPDSTIDVTELEGIDYDLVLRPFGVKGIAASLREFTIAALNQHHGIQATERFGWERTGTHDFDRDGVRDEFGIGEMSALVIFQASLPAPAQVYSNEPETASRERMGERIFSAIGCDHCHRPSLPLRSTLFEEPNPYNRPGALSRRSELGVIQLDLDPGADENSHELRAFTDLKRHNLCDAEITHFCNEKLRQDNVAEELFLTAKLWDLASSAPYGHRGDLITVSEAILAHGGEARPQLSEFLALSEEEKRALIAFLYTLGRASGAESE